MKETFDINKIESLVADQENVKGLLDLLVDILQKIKAPIAGADYQDLSDVSDQQMTGVVVKLLRNDDALSSIIRFLQDMNTKTTRTITNEVNHYYQDAR
ncbi:hypothetical protein [Limosilactobacillus coleohominis]|uniref:Uncharacterized protein n=1 Tax=Limosilactobacillus coleohominis TaxID=181675 RepID=A0ABS2H1N3_9LACO|nr:hypothetical protein [Limosilactobacillus coleohominis]MBM6941079.1 hypothetical protein [Limosilactobacillus coleohominis]